MTVTELIGKCVRSDKLVLDIRFELVTAVLQNGKENGTSGYMSSKYGRIFWVVVSWEDRGLFYDAILKFAFKELLYCLL